MMDEIEKALKLQANQQWTGSFEEYKKRVSAASEAVAHLQALRERCEWKPIITAPKDGKPFLVCFPRMGNLIVRAKYNAVHEYFISDRETEGGITKPEFYHEGDLWCRYPALPPTPTMQKDGE